MLICSLPEDVRWGSFVTQSCLPPGGEMNAKKQPQRTSSERLAYLTYQKFSVVPNEVKDGIEMVMKSLAQNVYIQCNP